MSFVSSFWSPDETTSPNLAYLFSNPPKPLAIHNQSNNSISRVVDSDGSSPATHRSSNNQEVAESIELDWEFPGVSVPPTPRICVNPGVLAASGEDDGKQQHLLHLLIFRSGISLSFYSSGSHEHPRGSA